MQTNIDDNIDKFTKRLLPLTVLRRNAGEVLRKLPSVGTYILTKDGKPVAKLTAISETKERLKDEIKGDIKKIRKLAGGLSLGKLSPEELNRIIDKQYEQVLP